MFKVSFKESAKDPSKITNKVGKNVYVYLKGTVALPEFWKYVPQEIYDWISAQTHVEVHECTYKSKSILEVYTMGVAKCREEDKYDSILGERLAEARAKLYIYSFFRVLSLRLFNYYSLILFGPSQAPPLNNSKDGLNWDIEKYSSLIAKEINHIHILLKDKYNE